MSVAVITGTSNFNPREMDVAKVAVVELDPRTRHLLEAPIVPTLLQLAAPNVLVMVVQASVGLTLEYYGHSISAWLTTEYMPHIRAYTRESRLESKPGFVSCSYTVQAGIIIGRPS